jgi:hypothetical protein
MWTRLRHFESPRPRCTLHEFENCDRSAWTDAFRQRRTARTAPSSQGLLPLHLALLTAAHSTPGFVRGRCRARSSRRARDVRIAVLKPRSSGNSSIRRLRYFSSKPGTISRTVRGDQRTVPLVDETKIGSRIGSPQVPRLGVRGVGLIWMSGSGQYRSSAWMPSICRLRSST